jgi:hypothetical protein
VQDLCQGEIVLVWQMSSAMIAIAREGTARGSCKVAYALSRTLGASLAAFR